MDLSCSFCILFNYQTISHLQNVPVFVWIDVFNSAYIPLFRKGFFLLGKEYAFSYLISPQKPTIYLFNKKIKFDWLRIFEVDVACILFFIRIFLTMSCFLSVENLYRVWINSAYYTIFYNSIYFSENNKLLYIAMRICIW